MILATALRYSNVQVEYCWTKLQQYTRLEQILGGVEPSRSRAYNAHSKRTPSGASYSFLQYCCPLQICTWITAQGSGTKSCTLCAGIRQCALCDGRMKYNTDTPERPGQAGGREGSKPPHALRGSEFANKGTEFTYTISGAAVYFTCLTLTPSHRGYTLRAGADLVQYHDDAAQYCWKLWFHNFALGECRWLSANNGSFAEARGRRPPYLI